MKEEDLIKAVQDQPDVLTKLARDRNLLYSNQTCPHCSGNSFKRKADLSKLFVPNDPLPHYQLECTNCYCQIDPHSGLIIKLGNVGEAFKPFLPLINKDS